MTSDKVDRSVARTQIDFSLGRDRTSLSKLRTDEFDELLREELQKIDLRELRGFKTLKDLLSRSPNNSTSGIDQDPYEVVKVSADNKIKHRRPKEPLLTLNSHVVQISRGVISQTVTYRRHESGKETTDWSVANSWGRGSSYVKKVEETILVLRRPNDHTRADQNLFEINYTFEKIPHKNGMIVTKIVVEHIPIEGFRDHFRKQHISVALNMVWELHGISIRTLDALRSQAKSFEPIVKRLERLADGIKE